MSREPRGLGKGLNALLGGVPSADQLRAPVGYINKKVAGGDVPQNSTDIFRVPTDFIEPNPYQPRLSFDQSALEELSASIKALGLIQPITVRRISSSRYQIISGERRYKACRMAGMTMIPAYVRDATDQGMLEMALVENIQREDLDPIETALSYRRLMDECSLTQEQMSERVGKKRATVANTLRLLSLPAKIQHDLKIGLITTGHAKAILGVSDPAAQEYLCDLVVRDGMSVRALEDMVRKMASGILIPGVSKQTKPDSTLTEDYNSLLSHLSKFFSKNITLRRNASGKGAMTIRFNSDEEVRKFLEVLEEKNL